MNDDLFDQFDNVDTSKDLNFNPFKDKISKIILLNPNNKHTRYDPKKLIDVVLYLQHPYSCKHKLHVIEVTNRKAQIFNKIYQPFLKDREFHLDDIPEIDSLGTGVYNFDRDYFNSDDSFEKIEYLRKKKKFPLSFFGNSYREKFIKFFFLNIITSESEALFTFDLVNNPKWSGFTNELSYVVKLYGAKEEVSALDVEMYKIQCKKLLSDLEYKDLQFIE